MLCVGSVMIFRSFLMQMSSIKLEIVPIPYFISARLGVMFIIRRILFWNLSISFLAPMLADVNIAACGIQTKYLRQRHARWTPSSALMSLVNVNAYILVLCFNYFCMQTQTTRVRISKGNLKPNAHIWNYLKTFLFVLFLTLVLL